MHFLAKRLDGSKYHTLSLVVLSLAVLGASAARAQPQSLFATNYANDTVTEYAAGAIPGTLGAGTTLFLGSLSLPEGLAFDAHGNLFVANGHSNAITEFAAGTTPGTFNVSTTIKDPSLNLPQGLAFDAHGNLFVANTHGNTITEFAAGATPGTFGVSTTIQDPSLNSPFGLTFDTHGNLFATNFLGTSLLGNTITEFAAGAMPGTFGAVTTIQDPGLGEPTCLTFDANNDLFVVHFAVSSEITEFAAGATPGTFGVSTIIKDPNLSGSQGLAIDASGNLFVSSAFTSTITELASTGTGTFAPGTIVATGLHGAGFLAFGPSAPPAVPEASTSLSFGLLLALGLGGLGVIARRRKTSKKTLVD